MKPKVSKIFQKAGFLNFIKTTPHYPWDALLKTKSPILLVYYSRETLKQGFRLEGIVRRQDFVTSLRSGRHPGGKALLKTNPETELR